MKLHLGCGKRNFPGWINIDLADLPHIHYHSSIDDLSMFDDETVELIYSSHTLEYFDREQVSQVLLEWNRVLKKNATLRLAVPDFDALLKIYNDTGELNNILGPLYGRMEIDTAEENIIIYHKTTYNFASLKSVLEANGFTNVKRYDWRKTEHANFDDHSQAYFPHMQKRSGKLISLNIEADKC